MTPWLRRSRAIGLGIDLNPIPAGVSYGASAYASGSLPGQAPPTAQSTQQFYVSTQAIVNAVENGVPNDPQAAANLAASITTGAASYFFPPYGAFVTALYGAAQAIAPVLVDIGLISPSIGCTHTGPDATPASWGTPQYAQSGPAAALWVAYADQLARMANCTPFVPLSTIVLGFTNLWNASHEPGGGPLIQFAVPDASIALPSYNAISLFGMPWGQTVLVNPGGLQEVSLNAGPYIPPPDKHINFHLGPGGGAITAPAPAASSSGITGVQLVVGATAAAVIGTGIYAWVKKKAYGQVWDQIFTQVRKPFKKR